MCFLSFFCLLHNHGSSSNLNIFSPPANAVELSVGAGLAGFVFADLLGFVLGFYFCLSLFFLFLYSDVIIRVFVAGVKFRRVIWRVEELLNWKSTAGAEVCKRAYNLCASKAIQRAGVWRGR